MPKTGSGVVIPERRVAVAERPLLDEPTRQLCSAVARRSLTPARLAVLAPGGHGKTAVLRHLAQSCEDHGTTVAWFGHDDVAAADLVLADDVHHLSATALAELQALADDDTTGLVIAARPWPRPAALHDVLARLRGQLVLRPLDRRRIAALLGKERAGFADVVQEQTLGVPGFVVRLATALRTAPESDPATLPLSALSELRPDIDRLPAETLSLLLAATSGTGLDVDLLAGLLGTDHHGVARAVDVARAEGLLADDGTPLPLVAAAVRALVSDERRLAVSHRLIRLRLEHGGPVLGLVRPLLDSEPSGTELAEAFDTAADEAAEHDPALAVRLHSAAAAAGFPTHLSGARWAEAAGRAGDLHTALRLADRVIAEPTAPGRSLAARTAATACVLNGQLDRAAELYRWSGTRLGSLQAALVAARTGKPEEARRLLDAPATAEPPTLLGSALTALARGTLESTTAPPTVAMSTLADAAETLEPVGPALFLPETPAAVGALIGMHCGELSFAAALLERATTARLGGQTAQPRHLLLSAWIALLRGDTGAVKKTLSSANTRWFPRDEPLVIGLRAGIARRTGDLTALRTIWADARESLLRLRVDLFTMLPLSELAIAAARVGEPDRLAHALERAHALLDTLGKPPLWSAALCWNQLHAAITSDQRDQATHHARTLEHWADHSTFHRTLADAAACWLDIVAGTINTARVDSAATVLHEAGFRWDAARLAGQAAIRTTDRQAMVTLLERARTFQGGTATAGALEHSEAPVLSERERQVAELVVAGLTYREVGDRLFISAKTVEHHMARMRQRLGVASRADLLTRLRTLTKN